jgi:hypothetical protein
MGQLLAMRPSGLGDRALGLLECDITDEQQHLVARASSTCMTLRGEDARSR